MCGLRTGRLIVAAIATAWACAASAHGLGEEHGWSFDPLIGSLMLVSLVVQAWGLRSLGAARASVAPPARIAAYAAAQLTLVVALFSPIDAHADSSFAWHMLQHLLLMLVAAPLFAASNAHFVALFALPPRSRPCVDLIPGRRASTRSPVAPWMAAAAFAGGLWLWHAPAMYEAALRDRWIHSLEHLVFLLTAAVFWRMVSTAGDRRLGLGTSIVLVTLVGLQGNLMAALITLAPRPIYPSYSGLGALADQQIAGLAMWVPAGIVYLASTTRALYRLVRSPAASVRTPGRADARVG